MIAGFMMMMALALRRSAGLSVAVACPQAARVSSLRQRNGAIIGAYATNHGYPQGLR